MSKPSTSSLRPQSLQARLSQILTRWPSDPVRPASVSVQSYLQTRLAQLPKEPISSTRDQQQQQQQQNHKEQVSAADTAQSISESSLNALTSLLNNRYARMYPLPQKLRRPASDPEHYDNVVREFDEAPRRDWWGRAKKRLAGLFRFS